MAPPPVQDLQHWTLVTSDVERSKRFYTEILGATPLARDWPPSVRFGNTTIDMFATTDDQHPEPGSLGQHHAYGIRLEDYDAWTDHLQKCGVEFFRSTHGTHRISIYVDDPDGYHIELTAAIADPEQGRREIEKRGLDRYTNPAGPQDRP